VWAVKTPHFNKTTGVNMKQSAFPISGSQYRHTEGMTLRDYFAAKAMQGFAAMSDVDGFSSVEEMAKMSYKWADAMLKARGE
jgi:hypothetical protein